MTSIAVNKYKEPYDVWVGRGTKFGNPFSHKGYPGTIAVSSLEESIASYEVHLKKEIACGNITVDELLELDGKRLACVCKPGPCHVDVLIRAINWAKKYKQSVNR